MLLDKIYHNLTKLQAMTKSSLVLRKNSQTEKFTRNLFEPFTFNTLTTQQNHGTTNQELLQTSSELKKIIFLSHHFCTSTPAITYKARQPWTSVFLTMRKHC